MSDSSDRFFDDRSYRYFYKTGKGNFHNRNMEATVFQRDGMWKWVCEGNFGRSEFSDYREAIDDCCDNHEE